MKKRVRKRVYQPPVFEINIEFGWIGESWRLYYPEDRQKSDRTLEPLCFKTWRLVGSFYPEHFPSIADDRDEHARPTITLEASWLWLTLS